MNNAVIEKKYPLQTYKIKRTNKTLGVDYYLFAPERTDNSCSPLELHNGFSRFLFTLVDKSAPDVTVTPKANIPIKDLACIKQKTDIAMYLYFVGSSHPTNQDDEENLFANSPAFTKKLLSNNYKGKTPAEVLIENPQEKENLIKTKQWLQANIEKFPRNKEQIEAIDDALNLLEIGELQGSPSSSHATSRSSVLSLYKTEYKHMSQKNEQGYSLVYSISITFDASKNYPFTVEITNCFAPIKTLPSGQRHPVMEEATHKTKSSMALSDCEWVDLITHLMDVKKCFQVTNFKPMVQMAQEFSYQNKA